MGKPDRVLRILIISDLETDRLLILSHLEALDHSLYFERIVSEVEFDQKLQQSWDLVLFMSHVSFISPLYVLQAMKESPVKAPVIFISERMGEESVATLIKAGAEDVVVSSRLGRLTSVVKRVVRERELRVRELEVSKTSHDAIAAREQMLAVVSHDIRNPLSAIHMEAQMIQRLADRQEASPVATEIKNQAGRIIKTSERLKGLIHDLLDRNKTEDSLSHLEKSKCDLSVLFQEVFDSSRLLIKEKNLTVHSAWPTGVILEVDKSKIYQTLNNLLGNAIKFAPDNGTIELAIQDNGDEYLFSVCDNGPGIKDAELKKAFNKYWTAGVPGRSGTGLGLFICKTIISAHGGQISGENLNTGGARFWFTLPKPNFLTKKNWVKADRPRVLVIDDDEDLRDVISWALSQEGYDVHSYANPREALGELSVSTYMPELVVIDFQMDEMSGTEFLKQVHLKRPEFNTCPVVMISASPEEISREESRRFCKEVIPKPLDLSHLLRNVAAYI